MGLTADTAGTINFIIIPTPAGRGDAPNRWRN
jgi:hypothetical protein